MIEQAINTYLTAATALQALIKDRLYAGVAPAGATDPYIVYYVINGASDCDHNGVSLKEWNVQFSIFSTSLLIAANVRDCLCAALDAVRWTVADVEYVSMLDSLTQLYESDTKLHHIPVDFTIRHFI